MARRTLRFVRPQKNTKVWIGFNIAATTIVASTASLHSQLNAAALALRPFTVLRTRALITYESDQFAAIERPEGILGKIVVTEQAVAAGIASIPDPLTEPNASWFVYEGVSDTLAFATSVGFQQVGTRYQLDSKAMRKVGINEQLVSVFVQGSAVGAILTIEGRTLVQLH